MVLFAVLLAGIALAAWYASTLAYAVATRRRRPVAGPPTMQLGAEPPAVVNLLGTMGDLTPAAADATLLDLAARRIVALHQVGSDPGDLLIRVVDHRPAGLAAYERRVFDRFAALAGDRFVPLRDVAAHHVDGGPHWLALLRAEVIADARDRGLVRARKIGSVMVFVCLGAAMVLGCAGVLPLIRPDDSAASDAIGFGTVIGWFVLTPVVAVMLLLVTVAHVRGPRYTDAGREVAGRWLGVAAWLSAHESLADLPPAAVAVWDRYLAYGVALGVNPVAQQHLELRVGRIGRIRTRAGRTVVVRYPRDPFSYTQAGVRATWSLATLAAWTGGAWLVASAGRGWPVAVRAAVLTVVALGAVRAGYKLVRSIHAKLRPVTVAGVVLAAHAWRPPAEAPSRWVQVVVVDGRSPRTRPWLVRADRAAALRPGQDVVLRAQPWTRYVLRITSIAGRPAPDTAATPARELRDAWQRVTRPAPTED